MSFLNIITRVRMQETGYFYTWVIFWRMTDIYLQNVLKYDEAKRDSVIDYEP